MQNSDYPFITPSTTCVSEDLLFFDTFSHSGSEKVNFDLVQFPTPVVIDFIKIVPLGQPVEAKIPGNVRLGATNPSNCELEFFINDLTKEDAHTMTDLGKFYCSEKATDFSPPIQIQTDGLLLRGSYRTLTLAIFGQIAPYDEKTEDEQNMLSAASPPAQTPASPVASERDIPFTVPPLEPQELYRRNREDAETFEESTFKSGEMIKEGSVDNDMLDDAILDANEVGPSKVTRALDEYSGSDVAPLACYSDRDKKTEIDYSTSPDQETNARRSVIGEESKVVTESGDLAADDADNDSSDELDEKDIDWSFKAATYRPEPLLYFSDPSITPQELSLIVHSSNSADPHYREATEKEIDKVKEMFDVLNCSEDCKSDDWVTLIEDLANDLANISLSQTVSNENMLKFLIRQVLDGLDYELALKQKQTGFKVRHLRAGLKLATILFQCGDEAVSSLLDASVPKKVLELYNRDQMSLPLRLLILKCLSAACDNVKGVEYMITNKYDWNDLCLTLEGVKEGIEIKQSDRSTIEREDKIHHKFDSIASIDDHSDDTEDEKKLIKKTSLKKFSSDKLASDVDYSSRSMTCYQYLILILLSKTTTRVTVAIGNLIKKIRLHLNLAKLSSINAKIVRDSEDNVFESESSPLRDTIDLEQCLIVIQDTVLLIKDRCLSITQPIRHLPARTQFQIKPNKNDTNLALFRWLKHFGTLDHLNNLLSSSRSFGGDIMSSTYVERTVRFQNLSLALIQQLLDSPCGTQFLLSSDCLESTIKLTSTLADIHPPKRSSHVRLADGIENCLSASLCREESLTASNCRDTSLRMFYNFKVFSCIDKLFHFHREMLSKRNEFLCDPEKVLHQLYIVSDHPYGLAAIVKHFSSIGNLDCLLRFLDVPDHNKHLEFVKETSIDYVLELVGSFFRLNNNVLEIAEEYLSTLLELCKTKEKNLSVRIKSLVPWINPFDPDQPLPLISYTEETFRQLTRVIRKSIPDRSIPFAKALDFELPPQMITAVRILRQLCIPPQVEKFIANNFDIFSTQKFVTNQTKSDSFMTFVGSSPYQQNFNQSWNLNIQLSRQNGSNGLSEESFVDNIGQISNTFKLFQPYAESICGELKYHYGIMQVFEQEGLKRLLNTLRELTGNYPRPIYQSAALSGLRGRIVLSYINSVIILLHSITSHLIDARGSEFKDISIIPVVLETYSLLCFVPKPTTEPLNTTDSASLQASITIRLDNYNLAQQTKKMIISILMSYTQMCLSVSESEEKVISKSMWTKMLKEVFEFSLSTPVFFYHGLDVLTQILPSPLPCASMMDSIDQEQLFKNINHRKLWSAHLHPLHLQIEQMISNLSICHPGNIRTLLYYLSNQLCDLSSNAACMVAKIITDTLLSYAAKLSSDTTSASENTLLESDQTNLAQNNDETKLNTTAQIGTKESAYAVKMVLNLLSNLITNQAFESAFSNHLQILGKKDEKLLANLHNTLRLHDDYKLGEQLDDLGAGNATATGGSVPGLVSVTQLIESIKSMNEIAAKDGYTSLTNDIVPPDELTKINLVNIAHKTSDRFSLAPSLSKTYRLKVLLDLNSRSHRTNETQSSSSSAVTSKRFDHQAPYSHSSSSSSHKPYVPPPQAPPRARPRPTVRPDSFRSRPQNTSRPPSIHVDDFIDLYGNSAGNSSSAGRFGGPTGSKNDYRGSSMSRSGGYPTEPPISHSDLPPGHRQQPFFGGPPPPMAHSGSPYSNRSQHPKTKYMKLK